MNLIQLLPGLLLLIPLLFVLSSCSESQQPEEKQESKVADTAVLADTGLGKQIFTAHCAVCHGDSGSGTEQGPPLVHKVYRPNHHSDYSIERAINFGVRSHHWGFGSMPPISGLSLEDIRNVTAYIRQQQVRDSITHV